VKNSKTISLFENNSIVEQEVIAINKIIFDFDETTRDYMISLIVIDNYGKEFKIEHSSSKILSEKLSKMSMPVSFLIVLLT
jgi:hypothetical protein